MRNVPNTLSAARIIMAPLFPVIYFLPVEHSGIYAALWYALAFVTDVLDGKIARKYNIVSDIGRILDPIGDKLIAVAAVACLTIDRRIPLWALAVLCVKELAMVAGGIFIHGRLKIDMPSSNIIGKSATLFLMLTIVSMLLFDIPDMAALIMISVTVCLSVFALLSYVFVFVNVCKKNCSD